MINRSWQRPSACAIGALVVLGLVIVAHAQDEGVKQVQELIKKSSATVKSIDETKLQIQKTMEAYNLVVATETTDRKSAYSKLQKEMETTEKKRTDVTKRADETNVVEAALVKSWSASTDAISDPALRAKSAKRLADTQARFDDIRAANRNAGELYSSFMKAMQDQVTFLGHDLNDSSVAALKPETEKLNARATALYAAIEKATAKANANIVALSPN